MLQNMAFSKVARKKTWNLTFNFTNDQEWYVDMKKKDIHRCKE